MKPVPENELFSAYLDGELMPDEQARIESLVDTNAEAAALVQSLRAVSESIQALPLVPMPIDLTATILANAARRMRKTAQSPHGTDASNSGDAVNSEHNENEPDEVNEFDLEDLADGKKSANGTVDSVPVQPVQTTAESASVSRKFGWSRQFADRSWFRTVRLTSMLLLACTVLAGISWVMFSNEMGQSQPRIIAHSNSVSTADSVVATAHEQAANTPLRSSRDQMDTAALTSTPQSRLAPSESVSAGLPAADVKGTTESQNVADMMSTADDTEAIDKGAARAMNMAETTATIGEIDTTPSMAAAPMPCPQPAMSSAMPLQLGASRGTMDASDSSHFDVQAQSVPPPRTLAATPVEAKSLDSTSEAPEKRSAAPQELSKQAVDFSGSRAVSNGIMYSVRNAIPSPDLGVDSPRNKPLSLETATNTAMDESEESDKNQSDKKEYMPGGSGSEQLPDDSIAGTSDMGRGMSGMGMMRSTPRRRDEMQEPMTFSSRMANRGSEVPQCEIPQTETMTHDMDTAQVPLGDSPCTTTPAPKEETNEAPALYRESGLARSKIAQAVANGDVTANENAAGKPYTLTKDLTATVLETFVLSTGAIMSPPATILYIHVVSIIHTPCWSADGDFPFITSVIWRIR